MKKSKIIIPALAMLVMSTAATVTGTVAWFTMNATAKAEGMVVAAKTSGSLIITKMDLTTPVLPTSNDKGTKVTFTDGPQAFYPSTHAWSKVNNAGEANEATVNSSTGLVNVSNGADINFETGTRMNSTTKISWAAVGVDDSAYYYDYGVYLAGDGMEMNDKTLTISIDDLADTTINGAISIDFYGETVTSNTTPTISSSSEASGGNFLGTLNLAKVYNDTAYSSDAKASLTISGVDIPMSVKNNPPQGVTTGAFAIRMRVYYDGALIRQGKPNNDYAVYTECVENEQAAANLLYYSDNQGSSIVPVNTGDDVEGLWKVNTGSSTTLYARSIDVINLDQRSISVTFTA